MNQKQIELVKRVQAIMASENTMYEKREILEQVELIAKHLQQLIDHVIKNRIETDQNLLWNLHHSIGEMNKLLQEIHEFRLSLVWYTKPLKENQNIAEHVGKWLKEMS